MAEQKIEKGCPVAYTGTTPKNFRYMNVAKLEAFFAQFDLSDEEVHEMAEAAEQSRREVG